MRNLVIRHHYLVAHTTQELSSWIVQPFHKHTSFESENRLDLRDIREINRVEVIHRDVEGVFAIMHQFGQGRHH